MTKKKIIIALILVAIIAGAAFIFIPKKASSIAPVWITTNPSTQNIAQSITATGTIEPVTSVDVGTQVSGILTSIYVDYNSEVKKGQVIAELDKSTLQLTLDNDKNSLAEAKNSYEYETANYKRVKALHQKALVADSDYELALYSYNKAANSYETAKNNVKKSEINLGYATIYSPIDGVVLLRDVEEGQTVASSFSTPTLFTIAADLTDMRVIADIDEADIGNVEEGQRVSFTVDAFPDDTFEGSVTQVRQQATIESNVVTYEVVISAANPDLKLKPGLTASVEVFILDVECQNVLPASALTFDPGFEAPTAPEGMGAGGRPEGAGAGMGAGGRPEGAGAGMGGNQSKKRPTISMEDPVVWIKRGEEIIPRNVTVGITNGILVQVDGVNANDEVVTGTEAVAINRNGQSSQTVNPFAQRRRR